MKIAIRTVLFMVFLGLTYGKVFPGDLSVIVHPENRTSDISFQDLFDIFKQDKRFWNWGKRIYLIMREAESPEKNCVLDRIYKMGDGELKKFWLTKLFKGEITSFPKTLGSNEAVKLFVAQVPNAVGYIDSSFVDQTIKVLRIDGKLPGEEGYFLNKAKRADG